MKPLIIGIAGGTASGKTTTSKVLTDRLDCVLITHDQYYKTLPASADASTWNFDHPDALDTELLVQDLAQLRAGQDAALPIYDFNRHARTEECRPVAPRPILLVEGILVLAEPALRDLMDHKVFVHAPPDVRLIRRIRRDVASRGRDVAEVLHQWEDTVRPMHERYVEPSRVFADLVVDGTTTTEAMVASVLGLIGLTGTGS